MVQSVVEVVRHVVGHGCGNGGGNRYLWGVGVVINTVVVI